MRALSLALMFALQWPAYAADITVEAQRRDGALEVACRALIEASQELVWQTLTDYDRLAGFIPGMVRSRLVSKSGAVNIVEQVGEARFLFISIPIEVTLASTERPPHAIEARMLRGTLRRMEGAYRIEPQAGGGVRLSWHGIIEADSLPPLIGNLLLRSAIEDQFRGMVEEIERRAVALRAQEPSK
jgi:carbon monoxide dehydrogenase subunit G